MKECGAYGLASQSYVLHDNLRDGDRMQDVGITAAPAYVLVSLVGKLESLQHGLEFLGVGTTLPGSVFERCPLPGDEFEILRCKL